MKILITGHPGSGKSIFARYLKTQYPDFTIIEFDECGLDRKWFYTNIEKTENCIVVIQHQKFLQAPIKFDKVYKCTRVEFDAFQVDDSSTVKKFAFLDFEQYFDPRLDGVFNN